MKRRNLLDRLDQALLQRHVLHHGIHKSDFGFLQIEERFHRRSSEVCIHNQGLLSYQGVGRGHVADQSGFSFGHVRRVQGEDLQFVRSGIGNVVGYGPHFLRDACIRVVVDEKRRIVEFYLFHVLNVRCPSQRRIIATNQTPDSFLTSDARVSEFYDNGNNHTQDNSGKGSNCKNH